MRLLRDGQAVYCSSRLADVHKIGATSSEHFLHVVVALARISRTRCVDAGCSLLLQMSQSHIARLVHLPPRERWQDADPGALYTKLLSSLVLVKIVNDFHVSAAVLFASVRRQNGGPSDRGNGTRRLH